MSVYDSIRLTCEHCRQGPAWGVMTTFVQEGVMWTVHVGCKIRVEAGVEEFRELWDRNPPKRYKVEDVQVEGGIL